MPKKIDDELKARAVRLVNDHQGEYSSLTAAAAVVAKSGLPLHRRRDLGCQFSLLVLADVQVSTIQRHRAELLILVRHARWQRDHVPMDMGVALLTAETHHVESLGRGHLGQRSTEAVDDGLHGEIGSEVEVSDHTFSVGDRGDQRVATLQRRLAQKDDHLVVTVDHVLPVVGRLASDDRADEAVTITDTALIILRVERQPSLDHPAIVGRQARLTRAG